MQLVLLIVVVSLVAISVIAIVTIRIRLKNKSKELSEKLNHISSYSNKSNYEQAKERLSALNNEAFIDIPTDLNNVFSCKIISATQEKDFTNHYIPYFQEAHSLVKRLEAFNITPSVAISNLIRDFGNINKIVEQHNDAVINSLLDTHKEFFDHCLKYPLDKQQRRSIVSEEDNCLVVSSAGSGKTSSIVGKVKYLTEIKGIVPHRILLISYTNKAAAELTERMATDGLKGYTFHKLAIDIIGKATGTKPSICDNTDSLFIDIYHTLLENKAFKNSVVEYFIDYQSNEADWEQRKNERREKLSEQKNVQLKAMFPDMDGRAIYVRSEQEQKICFVLSSLGVKFRYEEPYEHQLADEMHSQYRPDFSIYFEQAGVIKRIYLEHFGVDEHSLVPAWFAKDKNITYEEANQKYNDGITWKKAAHEKFGTQLLVTSSADFHYSDIRGKLRKLLDDAGVPIQEKTLLKSIFLLGRYSFDDYYLSFMYQSIKEGNRFFYVIGERKIEFLTVHKSKGLEADYVILLQCNKDTYGFPSLVSDDPVLKYVLTKSDQFPYGEERRLFYVAITRAKMKTLVLYDKRFPSVFVDEFLHPERVSEENYVKHPNANKRWTRGADQFLLKLHDEGKSVKYIAAKMGRSQTSIVMRLNKLTQ